MGLSSTAPLTSTQQILKIPAKKLSKANGCTFGLTLSSSLQHSLPLELRWISIFLVCLRFVIFVYTSVAFRQMQWSPDLIDRD